MTHYQDIAQDLVKSLSLAYEPVGVTLYTDADPLPEGASFTEKELKSYCDALARAGKGETLLLKKEQMGCKLGTSVLGFENDMEAFLNDGVLENMVSGFSKRKRPRQRRFLSPLILKKTKHGQP